MRKNTLWMICGVPGSGKSTLAIKLKARLEKDIDLKTARWGFVPHRETDEYFINARTGEYEFDPNRLSEYHRLCQRGVATDLLEGRDCIVTNTNLRQWERKPYFDAARESGCDVVIIHLTSQYGNVHGVPEEKVREMTNRWEPITSDEVDGIDYVMIMSAKELDKFIED